MKSDNHIDEANLLFTVNQIVDSGGDAYDKAKRIDQHYADFYRNKIPEVPSFFEDARGYATAEGYRMAIRDITAQFNSKEANDE